LRTGTIWILLNAIGFLHGRKAFLFGFYWWIYLWSQVEYLHMILCYLLSVEVYLRTGIIWIFFNAVGFRMGEILSF
jgi:hypothetical protein